MFKFKTKEKLMTREIRARFSEGMIKPLEKVEFKEGEELKITITTLPDFPRRKSLLEAIRSTAGGWKGLVDAEELKRNIYADRLISNRPEPRL